MSQIKTYSAEDIKEIGRRLRTSRENLKISQRQLADKINAEKNVVQRLESGKLKSVDRERLFRLASFLDCNPLYLLLESDDPRTFHSDEAPYYNAPPFQNTAEQFLYSHLHFKEDIVYMSKYMNPDFQEYIIKLIHTIILFHKCGVHFPNTTPQAASSVSYKQFEQTIKDNFFESAHSKWKRPKPPTSFK